MSVSRAALPGLAPAPLFVVAILLAVSHPAPELHIDALIFGGGIAGLWTLARLRKEGYSCLLLESNALGSGQTIASQGIIHGGIKYALTGQASAASKAIADMPAIWRACLEGTGEIDLRAVKVLSERQYLWTTPGIGSRIAGFAASKVIRTAVESIPPEQRPDWLKDAPSGVDVYAVDEPVLDPQSLVSALSESLIAHTLRSGDLKSPDIDFWNAPECGVTLRSRSGQWIAVVAKRIVLAAGEGNDQLLGAFEWSTIGHSPYARQQTRPLHMVVVRGDLPLVYGHCVGFSDKPRITITSQKDHSGRTIWYVGGDIAESGTDRDPSEQLVAARAEVAACVPWIDLARTEWSCFRINRAEGILGKSNNERPDEPMTHFVDDTILAYPTKLAFAPLLAERILDIIRADVSPTHADLSALADWPRPPIAPLPWDREDLKWT